ncbi:glutaminase [Paenibacillus alba]|nr:glutaminase [Paenibacillus alba]
MGTFSKRSFSNFLYLSSTSVDSRCKELVEPGIPFNPLINTGAIAISSLIAGEDSTEQIARIVTFFREIADNPSLEINADVYKSESDTAHRNRSLAYFTAGVHLLGKLSQEFDWSLF